MPRKTFESEMSRLNAVLEQLEDGSDSLGASMKLYKEGLSLVESALTRLYKFQEEVLVLEKSANDTFNTLVLNRQSEDEE